MRAFSGLVSTRVLTARPARGGLTSAKTRSRLRAATTNNSLKGSRAVMPMVGDGACPGPGLRVPAAAPVPAPPTSDPALDLVGSGFAHPPAVGVVSGAAVQALAAGLARLECSCCGLPTNRPDAGLSVFCPDCVTEIKATVARESRSYRALGVRRGRVPARGWWSPWPLTARQVVSGCWPCCTRSPARTGSGGRGWPGCSSTTPWTSWPPPTARRPTTPPARPMRRGWRPGHGLGW